MHFDIAWQEVDTVLLDMDGTLLVLAFDNYFWQTLVPETWEPPAASICRRRKTPCARSITPCSIR